MKCDPLKINYREDGKLYYHVLRLQGTFSKKATEVISSGYWNCCISQHGMNFHKHIAISISVRCMKSERSLTNAFIQQKLVSYLKKTNSDELLIHATINYPQFKDDSKKMTVKR